MKDCLLYILDRIWAPVVVGFIYSGKAKKTIVKIGFKAKDVYKKFVHYLEYALVYQEKELTIQIGNQSPFTPLEFLMGKVIPIFLQGAKIMYYSTAILQLILPSGNLAKDLTLSGLLILMAIIFEQMRKAIKKQSFTIPQKIIDKHIN